jgi:hypothetical protein
MLKIEKTKVEIELYGEAYSLSRPTVRQSQDYGKKVKDASDQETSDLVIDLLDSCGLPKKVTLDMEMEHLEMVIGALIPSSKK